MLSKRISVTQPEYYGPREPPVLAGGDARQYRSPHLLSCS
jgi:hypothetical protein